ncbi:hypothetical protein evm_006895, partial [Chilo suppressalis]
MSGKEPTDTHAKLLPVSEGGVMPFPDIKRGLHIIRVLTTLMPPGMRVVKTRMILHESYHHQPINVPTAGAQAFPMDGIGRFGHETPRGPRADWRVLTTADAARTNGLTCLPKHGGARDMEDASGRYTSMFYWGNNYWTGSAELCQVLNEQHSPAPRHNKSGGSQIFNEWRSDVSMSGLGPPFDTAFYTVRVSITSNLQEIVKTRRTLHLGLCLPYSCSRESVGALVGAAHAPLLRQAVVAVRSPQHGGYSYLHDPTFLVLLLGALIGASAAAGCGGNVAPQHGGYSYLHDPTFLVLLLGALIGASAAAGCGGKALTTTRGLLLPARPNLPSAA